MSSTRLDDVIRTVFKLDASVLIDDEHAPGDLAGWDSLGHVALMGAIEQEFQIAIDVEDVVSIENVGDIRRMLASKGITAH